MYLTSSLYTTVTKPYKMVDKCGCVGKSCTVVEANTTVTHVYPHGGTAYDSCLQQVTCINFASPQCAEIVRVFSALAPTANSSIAVACASRYWVSKTQQPDFLTDFIRLVDYGARALHQCIQDRLHRCRFEAAL